MGLSFVELESRVVEPEDLELDRALAVVAAVRAGGSYAALVETRATDDAELVVFDAEVERPQHPTHDIRRVERIAVRLPRRDNTLPEALAVREDFPIVPHLNQRSVTKPRNLCLYDQAWDEVRRNWSGPAFIERIRWWLARTARGDLHGEDQLLEPLMFSDGLDLVVSPKFGLEDGTTREIVRVVLVQGQEGRVLVADPENSFNRGGQPCLALYIDTPPRQHGIIHRTPRSLGELADLVNTDFFNLIERVRESLRSLPDEIRRNRESRRSLRPLLVLGLPKSRTADGAVEWVELKGFLCSVDLEAVGDRTGAWEVHEDEIGHPLLVDSDLDGSDIEVTVVNVVKGLTRKQAAICSGASEPDNRKIAAIGAGALGSQVAMNLARAGFGDWTLIDHDPFMPHNAVRHALEGGFAIGHNKAICTALYMNMVTAGDDIARAIPSNYLNPGDDRERIETALRDASLVLDMSASIPVARRLASQKLPCRAISLFLSPNGQDLVLLAEDAARHIRLDDLEMQYYTAIATDDRLLGHLEVPSGTTRYGGSCRDVSVQIPQAFVGTHAGIASAAIMQAVQSDEATVRVWRLNPTTMSVASIEIPVAPFVQHEQHGWRVCVASNLLRNVDLLREERLPNETGGIIIGGVDHERRCIHIVLALPSPLDSEEWPTMYIRGVRGLRQARERIVLRTARNLDYLGEWHSHPRGHPTSASPDDHQVFGWIDELARLDGRPPIMLICGDDGARVFVDCLKGPVPEAVCL